MSHFPAIARRISTRLVPYPETVAAMEARVAAIRAGAAPELVWFLEHPPLYTAGTSARDQDLLDPQALPVFKTGRGGQFTYHGPGQRIAYVMLDLHQRGPDLRAHVHRLEDWVIRALARLGVAGERRADQIGVWLLRPPPASGQDKIAAVGVRVRHWVSYHGVAINLAPDLARYAGIVPCGIAPGELGVTSLHARGHEATMAELDAALLATFADAFGSELIIG
ncbi:MAG: lipoyl(octanoyl) transferase LipB [Alphaproteobacteria bacterium]|nr:lipoyl(octanoyl) transferase LipB [Alphaproteobacteria bacterium]